MDRYSYGSSFTKGVALPDYHSMYQWSIQNRIEFWEFCLKYFPIIHEGTYDRVTDENARIDSIPDWVKWLQSLLLKQNPNLIHHLLP